MYQTALLVGSLISLAPKLSHQADNPGIQNTRHNKGFLPPLPRLPEFNLPQQFRTKREPEPFGSGFSGMTRNFMRGIAEGFHSMMQHGQNLGHRVVHNVMKVPNIMYGQWTPITSSKPVYPAPVKETSYQPPPEPEVSYQQPTSTYTEPEFKPIYSSKPVYTKPDPVYKPPPADSYGTPVSKPEITYKPVKPEITYKPVEPEIAYKPVPVPAKPEITYKPIEPEITYKPFPSSKPEITYKPVPTPEITYKPVTQVTYKPAPEPAFGFEQPSFDSFSISSASSSSSNSFPPLSGTIVNPSEGAFTVHPAIPVGHDGIASEPDSFPLVEAPVSTGTFSAQEIPAEYSNDPGHVNSVADETIFYKDVSKLKQRLKLSGEGVPLKTKSAKLKFFL